MEKRLRCIRVTVVRVLGEVFFLYGFLGWIYGVTIQLTHPSWLPGELSYLTTWIRVDTFTVMCFLLSMIGFFVWRLTKESAKS